MIFLLHVYIIYPGKVKSVHLLNVLLNYLCLLVDDKKYVVISYYYKHVLFSFQNVNVLFVDKNKFMPFPFSHFRLTLNNFSCLLGHTARNNLGNVGSNLSSAPWNLFTTHHTDPKSIP